MPSKVPFITNLFFINIAKVIPIKINNKPEYITLYYIQVAHWYPGHAICN